MNVSIVELRIYVKREQKQTFILLSCNQDQVCGHATRSQ